jgi:WhiB family redox-sensing transcriptional regulator
MTSVAKSGEVHGQSPTTTSEAETEVLKLWARGVAEVDWLMAAEMSDLPRFEDLVRRPQWMARAACRGNPAPFFARAKRAAQALCSECPVRAECLDFAMAAGQELKGCWGGMSERQRLQLRSRRRAVA